MSSGHRRTGLSELQAMQEGRGVPAGCLNKLCRITSQPSDNLCLPQRRFHLQQILAFTFAGYAIGAFMPLYVQASVHHERYDGTEDCKECSTSVGTLQRALTAGTTLC